MVTTTKKILILPLAVAMISVLFLYIPGAAALIVTPPYDLGDASTSGVLATATITTAGATTINGDVNLSPNTVVAITGPFTITGTTHAADGPAALAVFDALTAYNNLAALTCNTVMTGVDLAGKTLSPGVYCFDTGAELLSGGTLTLSGNGKYVFQTGTTLVTSTGSQVLLTGGATASDVFWKVGSSATLASGGNFKGTVIAGASISQTGGTGLTIDGRLFAPIAGSVTFVGPTAVTVPQQLVNPKLTVTSANMAGNTITGYYTTIRSGGSLLQTGFTPMTFTGIGGTTYTVGVQNYGSFVFDHWEDGSTVRARTLTLNSDTNIKAFYRNTSVPPPSTVPGTPTGLAATAVSSSQVNLSWSAPTNNGGSPLTGYKIEVKVGTGSYSTLVANAGTGTLYSHTGLVSSTTYTYRVSAINLVGPSVPSTEAAATTPLPPSPNPKLTVTSANMAGNTITGYYTTIRSGGSLLQTGFTPMTFTGIGGTTYTVGVQNYGSFVFDHWEDGSTVRARTLTLNSDTNIKAFYRTI